MQMQGQFPTDVRKINQLNKTVLHSAIPLHSSLFMQTYIHTYIINSFELYFQAETFNKCLKPQNRLKRYFFHIHFTSKPLASAANAISATDDS